MTPAPSAESSTHESEPRQDKVKSHNKGLSRMPETFTEFHHPSDPMYLMKRQRQIDELMTLSPIQLRRQLKTLMSGPAPTQDGGTVKNAIGELRTSPVVPQAMKGILDSTGGTTGNVLIRQDLNFGAAWV